MRAGLVGLAGVAALLAAGVSQAQPRHYEVTVNPAEKPKGFEKLSVSKAVVGAAPIRLWANTAIDPDCSAHEPGTTLAILQAPAHGEAKVSDEPFYAAFPPANPRSACNQQKVPGHQAFYTAEAGYKGRDRVVLQGSSPDGRVRQITVDIDVR